MSWGTEGWMLELGKWILRRKKELLLPLMVVCGECRVGWPLGLLDRYSAFCVSFLLLQWPRMNQLYPRSPCERPGQMYGKLWPREEVQRQLSCPHQWQLWPCGHCPGSALPVPVAPMCQRELLVPMVTVQLRMSGWCSEPHRFCRWGWQRFIKRQQIFLLMMPDLQNKNTRWPVKSNFR